MRLLKRKEVWVLTLQGWLLMVVLTFAVTVFLLTQTYPFLAISQPIQPEILVVDGWLPDYAIVTALKEFQRGHYQKIVTVGGPIPQGYYLSAYKSYAELGSATLKALGLSSPPLVTLPVPYTKRDRTLTAVKTVKDWLRTQSAPIQSVTIFTLGPHAHRSWMLMRRVLPAQIQVGVIAALPMEYEATRWWQYSEGVRSVFSELLAFVYAYTMQN